MLMKPEKLQEIWSEKDLCELLDLPVGKSGGSQQLTYWIKGGLPCIEKSGRRYFFEQDVIDYLWQKREESESE